MRCRDLVVEDIRGVRDVHAPVCVGIRGALADADRKCSADLNADLNGDGNVNAADLAMLLGSWGPCAGCPADFNGDDQVDAFDLAQLLGNWGPC